jgi:hypothetical protein
MNTVSTQSIAYAAIGTVLLVLGISDVAGTCDGPKTTKDATPAEVHDFFKRQGKTVVTLLGYSGAGYEDEQALTRHVQGILARYDPKTTIVNIGATVDGIGRIYELAKQQGFSTTGIVSTQAREYNATLSPCADVVFFVEDATWGGFVEGTERLSPTSAAMVDVSDRLVAIGGGEVTRDELTAAKRAGKAVTFIPADMNHRIAIEKAQKKGQAPPTDFHGAAHAVFAAEVARP